MTRSFFRRLTVTGPIRNAKSQRRTSKLRFELLEDRTVPAAIAADGLRYAMGVVVGTASHVRIYGVDGHQLADVDVTDMAGTSRPTLATGDVTGDGIEDVVVGSGVGITNRIRVINGATFQAGFTSSPFADFTGGVNVSVGDLSGDGTADIVASPNIGGGPRIVVISGGDFATVASFIGIVDANFRGGARTAVVDVNKDGSTDLIVTAGDGGGPRVAVFDGTTVLSGTPHETHRRFLRLLQRPAQRGLRRRRGRQRGRFRRPHLRRGQRRRAARAGVERSGTRHERNHGGTGEPSGQLLRRQLEFAHGYSGRGRRFEQRRQD